MASNLPIPDNEKERLTALISYDILDSESETRINDLTELASEICGVPIGLVSLIDEDRQWFKAKVGIEVNETPRSISFCQFAIMQKDLMEVQNALNDDRFKDNVLVSEDPSIRFYAGQPLIDDNGFALGTLCMIDNQPKALTDFQKKSLRILAKEIVIEIQDRKKRKERDVYKKFFENSLDLLCVANTDGFFKKLNPAFERTLGWTEEEMLVKPFFDLIHPDDQAKTSKEIEKLSQGYKTVGFENRFLKKNGGFVWLDWTSMPDSETGELYAVAHDVTHLKNLVSQLESNNKTLDQFAYTVSHDLKAPLRAISGFTEFLKEDLEGKLNETTLKYFNLIIDRSEKMDSLINGVLKYSKESKSDLSNSVFDSKELLEELNQNYLHLTDFKLEIDPKCPEIIFNKVQFHQIFSNLIDNAKKYNDEEFCSITITYCSNGPFHQYNVKDNGPGIKAALKERIFEIFYRESTEETKESSGIGLSIVKKILESNNGSIHAESDGENGSEFIVKIPKI